jgi:uncharacterized protein YdeI (BOF family)
MNTNKTCLLALLLAAFALPALADDSGQAQAPDNKAPAPSGSSNRPHKGFRGFGMHTVKNAPYSAQAVSERQQTLGDGNQISQRHEVTTWYRDSAGRTRLEMRDRQGELRRVIINDPVAGSAWTLDPNKRSAFKTAARGHMLDEARAGAEARRARVDAGGGAGDEVIVKRVERADGDVRFPRDVRIQVPKFAGADGTLRDAGPLGHALANAMNDAKWKKNMVTKDLGSKSIDGVKAEGKLRSYEIPAGEIGNRNPIVVSDETWYAPELQITVYTKHSDPRSGDLVFRLENLKREEPAAALFSVPTDYTVKDAMARHAP